MADEVVCPVHGRQGIGLACTHIAHAIDSGEAVGFFWGDDETHPHLRRSAHAIAQEVDVRTCSGTDHVHDGPAGADERVVGLERPRHQLTQPVESALGTKGVGDAGEGECSWSLVAAGPGAAEVRRTGGVEHSGRCGREEGMQKIALPNDH